MPRISAVKPRVEDIVTQDVFQTIFPYHKASSCFAHDGEPFWRRDDFIAAIRWINGHPNKMYHGFGQSSDDPEINKLEICSFLANMHQETGDPSLTVPYPWGWPPGDTKTPAAKGPGGGCLAICEGVCAVATFGSTTLPGKLKSTMRLSTLEKDVLGVPDDVIHGAVMDLTPSDQPNFGLGAGTGAGAVFQPGLVAVADDGTLYGDEPRSKDPEEHASIVPTSKLVPSKTDPRYAALGMYGRYGGRGAIQLSYNYNYSECSLALFGDYRLARYPNLITTTDRIKLNNMPEYFGFPGPNPKGNNQPPEKILRTTPPARVLAWATCLWFWMDSNRSGRKVSCHQAMLQPRRMGITTCNMIINNDSGCQKGSWAWNKNQYYERICRILSVDSTGTIVCPPAKEAFAT